MATTKNQIDDTENMIDAAQSKTDAITKRLTHKFSAAIDAEIRRGSKTDEPAWHLMLSVSEACGMAMAGIVIQIAQKTGGDLDDGLDAIFDAARSQADGIAEWFATETPDRVN